MNCHYINLEKEGGGKRRATPGAHWQMDDLHDFLQHENFNLCMLVYVLDTIF